MVRGYGVEGRVVMRFTIHSDGRMGDIEVLREPGLGLGDAVAVALKEMPDWRPAHIRGEAVYSRLACTWITDHPAFSLSGSHHKNVLDGEKETCLPTRKQKRIWPESGEKSRAYDFPNSSKITFCIFGSLTFWLGPILITTSPFRLIRYLWKFHLGRWPDSSSSHA